MRAAIEKTTLKYSEKDQVLAIWRSFRWRMKTLDGGYRDIQALCDEFIIRVQTEITHPELQAEVVKRFEQIRTRCSEFTTEFDSDEEESDED